MHTMIFKQVSRFRVSFLANYKPLKIISETGCA